MERDDIIKALECCYLKSQDCISCPFTLLDEHCSNLEQSSVALIKELTGTIDSMERQIDEKNKELDQAYSTITELTEEIKDLEADYDRVDEQAEADIHGNMADSGTSCHWCADKTKAETVKRMQEKLNDTKFKFGSDYYIYANNVDVIAKEILENKNDV